MTRHTGWKVGPSLGMVNALHQRLEAIVRQVRRHVNQVPRALSGLVPVARTRLAVGPEADGSDVGAGSRAIVRAPDPCSPPHPKPSGDIGRGRPPWQRRPNAEIEFQRFARAPESYVVDTTEMQRQTLNPEQTFNRRHPLRQGNHHNRHQNGSTQREQVKRRRAHAVRKQVRIGSATNTVN